MHEKEHNVLLVPPPTWKLFQTSMSRKQTPKTGRSNKKNDVERKRDERAARRAIAKDRKNRPQDSDDGAEFVSFSNQLQALGLKLREVPGDG